MTDVTTDQIELGRLAKLMTQGPRYIVRRAEGVLLKEDYFYDLEVSHQLTIPSHANQNLDPNQVRMVPLGVYGKTRIPTLTATGPDGTRLSILSRAARGRIAATVYLRHFYNDFVKGIQDGTTEKEQADAIWAIVQEVFARVAISPRSSAAATVQTFYQALEELTSQLRHSAPILHSRLTKLVLSDDLLQLLKYVSDSDQLIALIKGSPDDSFVITVTCSERIAYEWSGSEGVVRRVLAWLGLSFVSILRSAANKSESSSYYAVFQVPEGVETIRCFWASDLRASPKECDRTDGLRAVLSFHAGDESEVRTTSHGHTAAPALTDAYLDVQVAPSGMITLSLVLLGFFGLVSHFIYARTLQDPASLSKGPFVALASIFAVIPAVLGGAIVFRGDPFSRRLSRGPRTLMAFTTVLLAVLGPAVSLRGSVGDHFIEWTAFAVSVLSAWELGLFAYIQLGPRWRHSIRSRWTSKTIERSPASCQQKQVNWATAFLVAWTAAMVLLGRAEFALRDHHIVGNHFPINLWHAIAGWV